MKNIVELSKNELRSVEGRGIVGRTFSSTAEAIKLTAIITVGVTLAKVIVPDRCFEGESILNKVMCIGGVLQEKGDKMCTSLIGEARFSSLKQYFNKLLK